MLTNCIFHFRHVSKSSFGSCLPVLLHYPQVRAPQRPETCSPGSPVAKWLSSCYVQDVKNNHRAEIHYPSEHLKPMTRSVASKRAKHCIFMKTMQQNRVTLIIGLGQYLYWQWFIFINSSAKMLLISSVVASCRNPIHLCCTSFYQIDALPCVNFAQSLAYRMMSLSETWALLICSSLCA